MRLDHDALGGRVMEYSVDSLLVCVCSQQYYSFKWSRQVLTKHGNAESVQSCVHRRGGLVVGSAA